MPVEKYHRSENELGRKIYEITRGPQFHRE